LRKLFLAATIIIVSSYGALYIGDFFLKNHFEKKQQKFLNVEKQLCGVTSEDGFDAGYRNSNYVKSSKDFLSRLSETSCLGSKGYPSDVSGKRNASPAFSNLAHYQIDSSGLRGNNWDQLQSSLLKNKIGIFGGSTAFGILINEDHTIESQLNNMLIQDGYSAEIFNFAIPGGQARNDFNAFRWANNNGGISHAFFFNGFNDSFWDDSIDTKYINGEKSLDFFPKYKTVSFISFFSAAMRNIGLVTISDLIWSVGGDYIRDSSSRLENYFIYMNLTKNICHKNKIKCFFVLQPSIYSNEKTPTIAEQEFISLSKEYLPYRDQRIKSYPILDKFLRINFENYINGDSFLAKNFGGSYNFNLTNNKKTSLAEIINGSYPKDVEMLRLIFKNSNGEDLTFLEKNSQEHLMESKLSCDRKMIEIQNNGDIRITCDASSWDKVGNILIGNRPDEKKAGYQGRFSMPSDPNYSVLFNSFPENFSKVSLRVELNNSFDSDLISMKGDESLTNYIESGIPRIYNTTYIYEFDNSKNYFSDQGIKLQFIGGKGHYTGIKILQIKMEGRNELISSLQLNSLKRKNIEGNTDVRLEILRDSSEIFIDGAHLTEKGLYVFSKLFYNQFINSI
jgi:hypothetical protein